MNPQTASNAAAGAGFVVTAPGRVNLIGEHTDYNRGWVLPIAIERGLRMQVSRRSDRQGRLHSGTEREPVCVELDATILPGPVPWGRYVEGVLAGYQALGWKIPGFAARVSGDLPAGGGLSSSAALELATATAIETLCGRTLPTVERALLCQRAEHEFAGVPCGIMDQFAISLAQPDTALLLDCNSLQINGVKLDRRVVSVLVVHSGVKHALADGEYAKRRNECENAARLLGVNSLRNVSDIPWQAGESQLPAPLRKRVRHVLSENERTLGFAAALKDSDWETAGRLMYASHESLAADYEVSCPELDALVEIARTVPGVFGCRMTGGGFGGCVVALVRRDLARAALQEFERRHPRATSLPSSLFLTDAAGGPKVSPAGSLLL